MNRVRCVLFFYFFCNMLSYEKLQSSKTFAVASIWMILCKQSILFSLAMKTFFDLVL